MKEDQIRITEKRIWNEHEIRTMSLADLTVQG